MKVLLVSPRGFCAGVNMAIEALDRAVDRFGAPLYVYHEIVHNRAVVERFRRRGVVFVDSLDEVPAGGRLMYSAHGVSPAVQQHSQTRGLLAIDATCPLVRKVHQEAVRFARLGYWIVLVGHEGHDEVAGTLGEAPERIVLVESVADVDRLSFPPDAPLAYLTQTTLSTDDVREILVRLRSRFPRIVGPPTDDICYATQNRQEALKAVLPECDAVLVVGSRNSSNSNRLVEVARSRGRPAWLVDTAADIADDWFTGQETVLVTAGASAPEECVSECVEHLRRRFGATVEARAMHDEHVEFPLPVELR
jgi:4-hydroxy-3-methylbut-2-enyl diphosphate reductase